MGEIQEIKLKRQLAILNDSASCDDTEGRPHTQTYNLQGVDQNEMFFVTIHSINEVNLSTGRCSYLPAAFGTHDEKGRCGGPD